MPPLCPSHAAVYFRAPTLDHLERQQTEGQEEEEDNDNDEEVARVEGISNTYIQSLTVGRSNQSAIIYIDFKLIGGVLWRTIRTQVTSQAAISSMLWPDQSLENDAPD